MTRKTTPIFKCVICSQDKPLPELLAFDVIPPDLQTFIRKSHADFVPTSYLCLHDYNQARADYIKSLLAEDEGQLSSLQQEVLASLRDEELLVRNLNTRFDKEETFGEKLSDKVAEFGGSWKFISLFASILFLWVLINSVVVFIRPFDPYPFIFLNLILSCLAAIQAPVIMMSQNRQELKDRLRSEEDYKTNLKAELEIRHLHAKLDILMTSQWHHLMQVQEIQVDFIKELLEKKSS